MKNELSRGEVVYSPDVFQILAEYEIARSIRYPTPMGFLHIEMTPAGLGEITLHDASKIFTAALNKHMRTVDIPSGAGREYKILLPTVNEAGLKSICERLLSVFSARFNAEDGGSIAFSLNIGATSHAGGKSLSYDTLNKQAQTALKQSKLKGSNTFVIFL